MIDDSSPAAVKRLRRQLAWSERELAAARRVADLAEALACAEEATPELREELLDALAVYRECHDGRGEQEFYPDERWRARWAH